MTLQEEIPTLTEDTFQSFLSRNSGSVFVHETRDFNYHHYFPSRFTITKGCESQAVFRRGS